MSRLRHKDRGDLGNMRTISRKRNFINRAFTVALIVSALLPAVLRHGPAYGEESRIQVKKPAFAGSFYPADKLSLQALVDGYLKDARKDLPDVPPGVFAVIAPHAGYVYSGKAAAYSYNAVRGKGFNTVVLLGPSHRIPFKGVALYPSGAWETPLGRVNIDAAMARKFASLSSNIRSLPAAFSEEHSLEVQVPFLQRTLKDFKIVPLLTGAMEKEDIEALAETLTTTLKQNKGRVLLVVSSDMSHYHPYSEAVRIDSSTMRLIGNLNWEGLLDGINRKENELCGAPAVIAAMMAAAKMGGQAQPLHYSNSGDTAGDKSRVVGYGSVAFRQPDGKGDSPLTDTEKKRLLSIARKTLEEHVSSRTVPAIDVREPRLLERSGVFVTLSMHGQLRGCIGFIKPVAPLYRAVTEMTVAASSNDPRFRPVTKDELKNITIEISVLSPLKLINSINEIRVGTHGLYIVKGGNSGLLLPQVASQYRWGREEFLQNTCLKAGLPENAWKDKETKIHVFSAQIFSE